MKDCSKSIGEGLIRESQVPLPIKRSKSNELFPYILVASMNGMSSRAITRWLQEKHEIKLSAAMIAKVIRESDKRCLRLFKEMLHKETLMYSRTALGNRNILSPSQSCLFAKDKFEKYSPKQLDLDGELLDDKFGSRDQIFEAYVFIMDEWFSLPEQFRAECQRVVIKHENEPSVLKQGRLRST